MNHLIRYVLRLLLTMILLIVVFSKIDLAQFWIAIKSSQWHFLIIVWLLNLAGFWIKSAKMRFILKKQQCDVKTSTLFSVSAVTSLYSLIIPGNLSTAIKWYILKKNTGKGTNVFSGMLYNEFTETVVIVALGLISLTVVKPDVFLVPSLFCLTIMVFFTYLILLNERFARGIFNQIIFLLKFIPEKFHSKSKQIFEQLLLFQIVGFRFHSIVFLISLVVAFITGVILYGFASATAGIILPWKIFLWLPSVIYILGKLPISIANLGVREVTLSGILGLYGVETSSALIMSMAIFSSGILMTIIGGCCQLIFRKI